MLQGTVKWPSLIHYEFLWLVSLWYSLRYSDKDIDYEISSIDGSQIGKLSKQWSGLLQESFTDADNFGVSFPIDLDVKCKLTLLAAVFLIVSYS